MSYRAGDLLLVPGLLSLARVPLAVAFPFTVTRPWIALAVLAAAGLTDVVDGWWARRFNQATPTGAVVDPVTDKLFVLSVVVTLVLAKRLSLVDIALLATREIGEVPLVLWFLVSHQSRRARAAQPTANLPGKMATLLQFVAVAMALFGSRYTAGLVIATAITGVLAAIAYWARALSTPREA
jgi:CDP-diacylglycerol--glycerol-3-phosphate 3-phosphatidyltransferase/cardiolipin synthase